LRKARRLPKYEVRSGNSDYADSVYDKKLERLNDAAGCVPILGRATQRGMTREFR